MPINQFQSINSNQSIPINQFQSINSNQSIPINQFQSINANQSIPIDHFFLLNMLWSRHVKPSPAKGEKRKKPNKENQSLYRLRPFRSQHNVHSMIRCTNKERINSNRSMPINQFQSINSNQSIPINQFQSINSNQLIPINQLQLIQSQLIQFQPEKSHSSFKTFSREAMNDD